MMYDDNIESYKVWLEGEITQAELDYISDFTPTYKQKHLRDRLEMLTNALEILEEWLSKRKK